jgi:hypothetical protein
LPTPHTHTPPCSLHAPSCITHSTPPLFCIAHSACTLLCSILFFRYKKERPAKIVKNITL